MVKIVTLLGAYAALLAWSAPLWLAIYDDPRSRVVLMVLLLPVLGILALAADDRPRERPTPAGVPGPHRIRAHVTHDHRVTHVHEHAVTHHHQHLIETRVVHQLAAPPPALHGPVIEGSVVEDEPREHR